MFGSAEISTKALANLCRRLSISLSAGVDVRKVWQRETEQATGAARRHFAEIRSAVARGSNISDALDHSDDYFPEFFREMVRVGEETGNLPEVFRQLSENYEHRLKMRRMFVASILWPILELCIAILVVGVGILLMGIIPQLRDTDLFGFGLRGVSGFTVYIATISAIVAVIAVVYRSAARGAMWTHPLQLALRHVPKLGTAMETFALARLTWALHVTLSSGMELRKALALSLRSSQSVFYSQHIERILRSIRNGSEIYEAFDETHAFPVAFVDAVQVGEQSGMLAETMANLSRQYQAEARLAMAVLTTLFGFAVLALVAAIIIFLIYQVFTNAYLGPIQDALKPI